METKTIGARLILFGETESTNSFLLDLPIEQAEEGVVAVTEYQTAGRGRYGRRWLAPSHRNLLFSVLLRSNTVPGSLLTLAAACSAVETLRRTGLLVGIKWPNDVVHEGKKLGGVLCEVKPEKEGANRLVLGMGLNVNLPQSCLPPEIADRATSVQILAGHPVDRKRLLAEILNHLEIHWNNLARGEKHSLLDLARERCETLGHSVCVRQAQATTQGVAEDLDENGALIVQLASGLRKTLSMGEIVR